VRDRINRLLDPGSPFLGLSPLAAYVMYGLDGSDDPWTVPAAGIVTGIGLVSGRAVAVVANDATVKGGSYYPMTVKKHLRSEERRAEPAAVHRPGRQRRREPAYAGRGLSRPLSLRADLFNQANLSAQGVPQVAAVMGSCTAGGAYVPAMSDETVIVRNEGTTFLGGPAGEGSEQVTLGARLFEVTSRDGGENETN
jgi:3-methylcrotonyl-CoA carboxylase beta subunit